MTTLTPERIAELRALLEKATRGDAMQADLEAYEREAFQHQPALLDAAERAAKWRAVAEELAEEAAGCARWFDPQDTFGNTYHSEWVRDRLLAALARFAALREREQAIEQAYWRGSSEALVDTPWGSVDGVHKAIEQARKDEREAMYDMVQREDSRSLTGVSAHDPLRRLMDAIRARGAR